MKLPDRRRFWIAGLGVLLGALILWLLLGYWIPQGSERFYVLLPPLALGLVAACSLQPWQDAKQWLRGALVVVGFWIVLCTAGSLLFFGCLCIPEILVAAYFILALKLLMIAPLHLGQKLVPASLAGAGSWRRHLVPILAVPLLVP